MTKTLEQAEREREAVSAHLAACAEKLEAAERALEELLLHPDPLDARFVELQRTAEARMEELQRERDEWMLRCRQLVDAVDAIRPELDSLLKAKLHSARERDR